MTENIASLEKQDFDLLIGTAESRIVERNGAKSYIVGEGAKDTGDKRLPQIFINCEIGDKLNRKFASVPLHEIPLMRRLHRTFAGSVDILTTGYAPGLKQVQWLTAQQLYDEHRRLAGDATLEFPIAGAYIVPARNKEDKQRDIFVEIYGTGRDGAERFFKGMASMALAWFDLSKQVREQVRKVSNEDVEAIIDLVDPRQSLATIEMPKLPDIAELAGAPAAPPAGTEGDVELEPADSALIDFLTEKKSMPEDLAKKVATMVANVPVFGEEQAKEALGDRDHHTRRKAILTALEEFKKPAPPLPQLQA